MSSLLIARILANPTNTRLLLLFYKDSQLSKKRLFMDIVSNKITRLTTLALDHLRINVESLFHCLPPDVLPIRVTCKAIRGIPDDDKEML